MARRISRKQLKHDEFVEAAFDFGHWVEENWQKVVMAGVAVVVVVLAIIGWSQWRSSRVEEASRLMGQALSDYRPQDGSTYSPESLAEARAKFDDVTQRAGDSGIGAVARYYSGLIDLQSGRSDDGIRILEALANERARPAVAGTARARLAQAYEQLGELDKAAELWRQLADDDEGFYPQSVAMLNLGRLLQRRGDEDGARRVLNDLLETHAQSAPALDAQRLIDRLGPA